MPTVIPLEVIAEICSSSHKAGDHYFLAAVIKKDNHADQEMPYLHYIYIE
jgi:hypothetical protein